MLSQVNLANSRHPQAYCLRKFVYIKTFLNEATNTDSCFNTHNG